MFLWVSSCLSSFFCFFLLCFSSSFDISRVRFICSTCFCPIDLPLSFIIGSSLYSLGIFFFSLCVFVLAFLSVVVGSLFGHFLVSWLHLFCACFVLCVVCKTCSQFICFGSQQNPPFGQHLSFASRHMPPLAIHASRLAAFAALANAFSFSWPACLACRLLCCTIAFTTAFDLSPASYLSISVMHSVEPLGIRQAPAFWLTGFWVSYGSLAFSSGDLVSGPHPPGCAVLFIQGRSGGAYPLMGPMALEQKLVTL